MHHVNIITRRGFLDRSFKLGLGVALSTLVDIPLVVRRALAENGIGLSGKKVLFIFLRGANDSINAVIPSRDDGLYSLTATSGNVRADVRPDIGIPLDTVDYTASVVDSPVAGVGDTFGYSYALRAGNGFAALHPSLKFLAPGLQANDLAILHRVGYPNQSRSHFDSQRYWENGTPNNNTLQEGIFYRAMIESGLANTAPLTGVSFQSALPLLLRGSGAAMTNLNDPTRYNLLGIPYTPNGEAKSDAALAAANNYPFPSKLNRDLLASQYRNLSQTLDIFSGIDFNENLEQLVDDPNSDGSGTAYRLFPTSQNTNGGYLSGGSGKYVVDTGAYSFFKNLRAAALVLNKTDAIVAGTELTGWDTHNNQGATSGTHANLLRRVGWAMYALRKYFTRYGRGNNAPSSTAKVNWNDIVVVTLSEFGRTTKQNGSVGTDHAEAGCMFVAGGSVNGGIYGCSDNDAVPWVTGDTGSLYGVSSRYLKRAYDYRSVLGKIIRDHLGATQPQLNNIIPGYANAAEHLGVTTPATGLDGTMIMGEPAIL